MEILNYINGEWVKTFDPLPILPPNQRADLGEGEQKLFMNIFITSQRVITPPPIVFFNWGRAGWGSDA